MKQKFNVVVAGAGPSGLVAAWKAAEKGLSVLVVEKKANLEGIRYTSVPVLKKCSTKHKTHYYGKKKITVERIRKEKSSH